MRFLKKKALWFTLYGILMTIVFLYLLFPGDLLKQRMENALQSKAFILKAEALNLSLPLGMKLKNVSFHSTADSSVLFQGEWLDLQLSLLSFFQKYRYINFAGQAYSGSFEGRVGLISFATDQKPAEGKINFQNIDLAKYAVSGVDIPRGTSGKVRGSFFYSLPVGTGNMPTGAVTLFLTKGTYPLPEPFLGISKIEFDRGEIQGQMKNGSLRLEKLEIFGQQMNCILKGDITLDDDFRNSRLNLKGVIEVLSKNKVKMNVTIGGTLAAPAFQYI
jgi:type II secretion system protein N